MQICPVEAITFPSQQELKQMMHPAALTQDGQQELAQLG
jgi:hypothetical protein